MNRLARAHRRTHWRVPPAEHARDALDALALRGHRQDHTFSPQGSSAVCVADTVTVAIHTWPELGLATLDHYGPLPPGAEERLAARGWTPLPEDRRC